VQIQNLGVVVESQIKVVYQGVSEQIQETRKFLKIIILNMLLVLSKSMSIITILTMWKQLQASSRLNQIFS
jgi:hypothetical protein